MLDTARFIASLALTAFLVLVGFSFFGVYDAIIDWAYQPWLHVIVGVICVAAARYLLAQKEEQA
ncbi:MAG: hypothetical protein ABF310_06675 [Paracoccaceae bacterium]|jgi:hypothetical protein